MSREIDRRDLSVNNLTLAREAELRSLASEVSDQLPGNHRVTIRQFDPLTGNPAVVVSEAAPAGRDNYIQRALNHLQDISLVLGLEAMQAPEFVADPQWQKTSSGAVAVHAQQQYKGIPIFQANETVRFAPDGTLQETTGSSISVSENWPVAPRLTVQQAVLQAAQQVAEPDADETEATDQFGEPLNFTSVDLSGFTPKVIASFSNQVTRDTVLEAGPFAEKIKASLIWFPLENSLRLGWEVLLTLPHYEGQYRTIVDAETGEILYCRQLMEFVAARGNVYRVDGGSSRQMMEFPLPLPTYNLPIPTNLPTNFPYDWVEADKTVGLSTNGHLGNSGPPSSGTIRDGVLTFDPTDPTGDDQKILNIFYYNCYMHDYFYLLGFQELDGNFQQNNFGQGGFQSDRVDARAHSGRVQGTANMATPVDGLSPIMNMGLVTSTNRHTAFDSSVVFHEFMHGVTNRLVGGPMNDRALEAVQSRGMGEGWSDYIACMINNSTVVGAWVVNSPSGIRQFPYTSSFPDNFSHLGTGRYVESEHNIGEIWCATLLEMNRKIGAEMGLRLVMDALKLSPANPSFLDMRDAIFKALANKQVAGQINPEQYAEMQQNIWAVFARFGMGPQARSNGATTSGIVADFNPPGPPQPPEPAGPTLKLESTPNLAIPDNQPAGVSSVIAVAEAGQLTRITVAVEIEHPYIGDLEVSLIAPGGSAIALHSRSGASADNLIKTYSSNDTPALAAIAGQPIQGNWTIKVADRANQDTGTLRRWNLEIVYKPESQIAKGVATPASDIPDNDPKGLSIPIAIAQAGKAQSLTASVDITHTYIGDLRVLLIAPSGQQIILHDRTGGSQDNLIKTYDSTAHLLPLIDQPIQGNWVLQVIDLAGRDVGKLNQWSLEIVYAS